MKVTAIISITTSIRVGGSRYNPESKEQNYPLATQNHIPTFHIPMLYVECLYTLNCLGICNNQIL